MEIGESAQETLFIAFKNFYSEVEPDKATEENCKAVSKKYSTKSLSTIYDLLNKKYTNNATAVNKFKKYIDSSMSKGGGGGSIKKQVSFTEKTPPGSRSSTPPPSVLSPVAEVVEEKTPRPISSGRKEDENKKDNTTFNTIVGDKIDTVNKEERNKVQVEEEPILKFEDVGSLSDFINTFSLTSVTQDPKDFDRLGKNHLKLIIIIV